MKLARFWIRQPGEATDSSGQRVRVTSRGWSNESMEAAAAVAREMARKVAERVASGQPKAKQYGYGDRPLPEPVIQELRDESGAANGVITRNAYGALVMNTRDLMFVDIDREGSASPAAVTGQDVVQDIANELVSGLSSLFGKPAPPTPAPALQRPAADGVVTEIQRVAARNNLSVRIYKTAAGYRALIFNLRFDPTSAQTEALLREFGSDALYIRLCKMQESFRARLTPKPWRLGMSQPPVSFPFEGPNEEARFYEWVGKYTAASQRYATCRFVAGFGAGPIDAGLQPLIAYHDQETKVGSTLPLA
ncbi:MAG TPA: hypothetical protein VGV35_18390 [Bryobacteraceae bacterium]|nr:hypothetical protein [Bryobacteraceae bacterium]